MTKDQTITEEFKETRAAALNAVIDTLSSRCVALRAALFDAEAKIAELEKLKSGSPDAAG